MKINSIVMSLLFMAFMLSGCAGDEEKNDFLDDTAASTIDGAVVSTVDGNTITYNEDGTRINDGTIMGLTAIEALMLTTEFTDPASPLSKRVIYFEYDSSQVLSEFYPVIEAHAHYLMTHPNQRVVLQGHSDERGTREYNIALAEQRAKSVFKMMQLIGVMSNQVDIVSYGEEKPVAMGANEDSLALNRRVEIVYQ
ncbi:MAG: peptidoglycan-associated lipoprotein Pal [Methyloprofundus sp.]|nr:peptidoglycan-associated lipoprotein Pal [Methyloprofundus sp.]